MKRVFPYGRRLSRIVTVALIVTLIVALEWRPVSGQIALAPWPVEWQADSSFFGVWSRTDGPLAAGTVTRSWLWGPLPFAVANEPYAESSTGKHLVEYFDKGRMEINDPSADRSSPWFVSSGLLVNEMVTGEIQTGNSTFESRSPADIPVAGDASSTDAPTYAAFVGRMTPSPDQTGKVVNQKIDRHGNLASYDLQNDAGLYGVDYYDEATKHNVPGVFATWMGQIGTVLAGGRLIQDRLVDPLFVLGHPITDAYWATIMVDGTPTTVLVQLFERRALTYNPANAPEWRVEMANVGRAYFDWRYKDAPPRPAISAEITNDGVAVRGWNWPGPSSVSVLVTAPSGGNPLAGPSTVSDDSMGRFALQMPLNQALEAALGSGAPLQIKASVGNASSALPLAGRSLSGDVHIEGVITQVNVAGPGVRFDVTGLDGRAWRLNLATGAAISYSEGTAALPSALDAGEAVVVDGTLDEGVVAAARVKLLSESGNGARVNYEWSADGRAILVSGTGWSGRVEVSFAWDAGAEPQPQFADLTTDSTGTLAGSITAPANLSGQASGWLFAAGGGAQVAVPMWWLGSAEVPAPPELYITAGTSVQAGGLGSYCTRGKCFQAGGVSIPSDTISARPGETLGLRAQTGTDPLISESLDRLSVQVYAYPDAPGNQTANGELFFAPKGIPLYGTGDLPGHPFSLTLSPTITPGKYAVVVSVGWPDTSGANSGVFGFAVQVP